MTIKLPPRLTVVPKLRRDRNQVRMFEHDAARFGGWYVHLAANRLCRGNEEARISPKATAVLACLLAAPNQVIARDALIDTVWADSEAGEEVLTQVIAELRRALGGAAGDGALIETVRKAGYLLRAEVHVADTSLPARIDEARKEELPAPPVAPVRLHSETTAPVAVAPAYPRALLILLACAIALAAAIRWQAPAPAQPAAAAPMTGWATGWTQPAPVTWEPGPETPAAISPDGEFVIYRALEVLEGKTTGVLRVRRIGDAIARDLVRDDVYSRALAPAWFADGKRVLFARVQNDRCDFRSVPISGGDEQVIGPCTLLEGVVPPFDLGPDDRFVIQALPPKPDGTNPTTRVVRTELATGERTILPYDLPEGTALSPRYSPNGRQIAFLHGLPARIDVFVMPADGGSVRRVSDGVMSIRSFDWLPDGDQLVLQSVESMYLLDLVTGVMQPFPAMNAARPVAAWERERIVYTGQPPVRANLFDVSLEAPQPYGLDNPPARKWLLQANAFTHQPRFSHRGDQLAFVSDRSGDFQVWVATDDGLQLRQISELPAGSAVADTVFSGDDSTVLVAYEDTQGHGYVVRIPAMGGNSTVEFDDPSGIIGMTLGYDDRDLYVASRRPGAPLLRVDRSNGSATALPVTGVTHVRDPGDGYLYYDARDHLHIERRSHRDGQVEVLTAIEKGGVLGDFDVIKNGIVYGGRDSGKANVIKFYSFADRTTTTLSAPQEDLAVTDLAVTANLDRLLLVGRVPVETDLFYIDRHDPTLR